MPDVRLDALQQVSLRPAAPFSDSPQGSIANGAIKDELSTPLDRHDCDTSFVEATNDVKEWRNSGKSSRSYLQLHHNVTVSGAVEEFGYVYFVLCVASHMHYHRLYVKLRAFEGDADLYMSSDIPNPRIEKSTWLSADAGDDSIVLTTDHDDWRPGSRALYIGVFGRDAARFELCVNVVGALDRPSLRGKRRN